MNIKTIACFLLSITIWSSVFPVIEDKFTQKEKVESLYDFLKTSNNALTTEEGILIKNEISTVVIMCPALVTGGPENLCQISLELKKLGFNVYLLWFISESMIKRKYQNSSWYLCGNSDDLTPNIYKAEYEIEHLKNDVILDKSTMIILPEGMCDFLPFFNDASKMIAWLSINNMHGFDRSNTCRDLIDKKSLRLLDCSHAAQAPWIQKVLSSWGAKSFLLGDYINKSYFNASPVTSKENCIAYYPSKGRHLGEFFAQNNPMYKYIRLQNLNSFGMLWALDTSKVYIDFGHFPGKDRIPREALLRGCIIFIHNQGCATDYESFPVDDYFRFSDTDVIDGTLEAKIRNALDNYEDLYAKQELILNSVKQEYFSFSKQVSQIFGSPKRQF